MSLAYTRKFIILKKEFSTMAGRNPKGYCKLEIKGLRGTVNVNIENGETDNFYNILFIFKEPLNTVWELGKIFTDEFGKGKGECTFIQRELEAKNFSVDKISAILITRGEEVFLGGYIDKEDGSIEKYISYLSSKKEPQYHGMSAIADPIIEEPIEDILEDVEPSYTESIVEQAYNPIYDIPAVEPMTEVEETGEMEMEEVEPLEPELEVETESIEEPIEEPIESEDFQPAEILEIELQLDDLDDDSMEPDQKTLDYIKKLNQKNQTTNYVLSILRFFPYIDPFKYDLKGYNWWIVELDKENEYRAFLPYFSYIVGGNTKESYGGNAATCNELMNKYEHYLFGIYNEGDNVKYFVYGIPGGFVDNEHPYRGVGGFNTWYQGKYVEGYWLIYIDPMTGKPINPVVPMAPIK